MSCCSSVRAVVFALAAAVAVSAEVRAQGGAPLSGVLIDSLTGAPVPDAVVTLDELKHSATSAADGRFTLGNVPPGAYHLSVRAAGYSSKRTEVTVTSGGPPVTIDVDPELHFEEVVSVGPAARSQFDTFQPTSVLSGQELTKRLEMSLGATLEEQPGVAVRSFGPAPARPVIRGLDGDRVQILQDGQRLGDLSSQSGDHGVQINPAAATRIEVVRGPATLLYGANAIGGLVNVITDEIPTTPQRGVDGNVTLDIGSAAKEGAAAGDVHVGNGTFALHMGGGGRRSGDVRTPAGTIDNSQSRNGFGNLGLAWTGERGFVGGSYGYDDTRYGIPVVEGGTIALTPRRHAMTLRGGAERLGGAIEGFRVTLGHRRYRHDEVERGEIGTRFTNTTTDLELMGSHRALGRLKGSAGVWVHDRAFGAEGAEALSPPVDQHGFAAFVYEEVTWPHVTVQFGGRIDRTTFAPLGEPRRAFTNGSSSVGLLWRPPAMRENLTVAMSLARAARNPALEELFFFGLHHGNFAIEVGNPALRSERALGVDLSLRWRGARASGEVTYFRNAIDDFIFRDVIGLEAFEAREAAFVDRFGGRAPAGHDHAQAGDGEDLAFVEYVGADALLQGLEAHADLQLTSRLSVETGLDYVQGALRSGTPLPRMPPLRGRAGLRYQVNAFQIGGDVTASARQDRVSGAETPTASYGLVRLFASYSFGSPALSTITARLDNATDTPYRNHLSLIKHLVPETGANFKLLYNVRF